MTDEQPPRVQDQPKRSTSEVRQTMGMKRISSRPGGRRAPMLLTVIVLAAVAIAVAVALIPGLRGGADGAGGCACSAGR